MAISLGSNISSLQAQRRLSNSTDQLSSVFERLSSGQRINKASDDAAGLAIADSLRADQRIATVAIRNANDGISTIAIADSALGQIGNVLSRLAELAEQSANGVYSTSQRSALSNEFVALASEIERIATTTEFNGVTLLSGARLWRSMIHSANGPPMIPPMTLRIASLSRLPRTSTPSAMPINAGHVSRHTDFHEEYLRNAG